MAKGDIAIPADMIRNGLDVVRMIALGPIPYCWVGLLRAGDGRKSGVANLLT